MRFLLMIRLNENTGQVPSERLINEMGELLEELTQADVLLDGAGLRPTSEGARVRLRSSKLSVIDGPFTETKEVIGGYALVEAASMQEAIGLARRFVEVHGGEWDIDCEVRQLDEPGGEPKRPQG